MTIKLNLYLPYQNQGRTYKIQHLLILYEI